MIAPFMYVLLSFVPSGILIFALWVWRTFADLKGQRVPVKDKLLRPPGESARRMAEQLDEKVKQSLIWVLGFPAFLVMLYLAFKGTTKALAPGFWEIVLVTAIIVYSLFSLHLVRLIMQRNRWMLGFRGECATGESLNQLMLHGCRVFHDVPLNGSGNLDHVVIAPSGVYAVETKTVRKGRASRTQPAHEVNYDGERLQFPRFTDTRALEQTRLQADQLCKMLSDSIRFPVTVTPVLALPGWYVKSRGVGDVIVLNPKLIDSTVITTARAVLPPGRLEQLAGCLDAQCRDVEF